MKLSFLVALSLVVSCTVSAQDEKNAENKDAAYIRTINSRAQKIVATLGITDSSKFYKIQAIIANQYRGLNDLHNSRDEKIKSVNSSGETKEAIATKTKTLQNEADGKIASLHKDYISHLSAELSETQVAKVKDGMTYNVVNITYAGYLDMLPNLNSEQKAQIMTWLVEAREHAMDAETSDKKHGWFGKYKGRINNYLSAAGYDLKKEGEAWQQRIKEREQKKNTTKN